jgi:uncharacterized protein involved in exopolysaccharide biosynthesis
MEDEIDLKEYLTVILKHWKLVVIIALISAGIAFVQSIRQPKLYRATATIMIVDSGGGGLASALSAMPFLSGGGLGGGEAKLTPILQSLALAKQVAKNLDKQKYFPQLYLNNKLSDEQRENIIAGSLQGAVEEKSQSLYNVSIVWQNPEHAAELANIYVEELGKFLNTRGLNINFQSIDPAIPPDTPFNNKINSKIGIGFGVGSVIGCFMAFFLEFLGNLLRRK